MGGEERAIATASSMQSGMRSALNSSAGRRRASIPHRAGSTELMTIEEMLAQEERGGRLFADRVTVNLHRADLRTGGAALAEA
jgi:hypothetical protein